MNAHHTFTEPYYPAFGPIDPDEIDAELQREAYLREWARLIVEQGPRDALKVCLRADEVAEWTRLAKQYLACDGDDDGDFAAELDALDVAVNPRVYGAPDADWRGSLAAETHFGGRLAA